jgi:peptidase M1-like protein/ERAP1-like protein
VIPLHYSICLTLDPERVEFAGRGSIKLEVLRSISKICINAQDLQVEHATITAGGDEWPVTIEVGIESVVFGVHRMLQPGVVVLRLEWKGMLREVPEGLFRIWVGDTWYVYSQFEPSGASQAFPCLDHPRFRATYAVTLRIPRQLVALSNAPEVKEEYDGFFKTVHFATSRPLPSCLVAVAIGPFDLLEAPQDAIPGVRLRAITCSGLGKQIECCLQKTPLLVNAIANWLGDECPYKKIDLVAVPDLGPGAVENPGLLMFRERILLDSGSASSSESRKSDLVITHEVAHMWFGGLVGISSWDEIWLSESLATWLANKIVSKLYNEIETETLVGMLEALEVDAHPGTPSLRRHLETPAQVLGAFDVITYAKGPALLRMIEQWMGEENFREAIHLYVETHRDQVARSADLIAAMARVGGEEVAKILGSFLDAPGAPLLEITRTSSQLKPAIRIQQTTLQPSEDGLRSSSWRVPVRIRYGFGEKVRTLSILVCSIGTEVALDFDPEWLHPNLDEAGYYQWSLPNDELALLVRNHLRRLSPAELLALPRRLQLLLLTHRLSVKEYCELLMGLGGDPDLGPAVQRGVLRCLKCLRILSRGLEEEPAVIGFIRRLLNPQLEWISSIPTFDLAEVSRWRRELLWTLAEDGCDENIREHLAKRGRAFVAGNFQEGLDEGIYCLLAEARGNSRHFFTLLVNSLSFSTTPAKRDILISTLGGFTEAGLLRKSLDLYLSPLLRSQDLMALFRHTRWYGESLTALVEWLDVSYERIVAKAGTEEAALLPWVASDVWDLKSKNLVMGVLVRPDRVPKKSELHLNRVIDQINNQIRWREVLIPEIRMYFGGTHGSTSTDSTQKESWS